MSQLTELIQKLNANKIDWSKYPSIKGFEQNKLRAYFILHVLEVEFGIKQLSASEIATILTTKFKKTTTSQAIRGALDPFLGDEVEVRQREDGVTVYSLLPPAQKIIGVDNPSINLLFSPKEIVIPLEIFDETKDYIKKVAIQINGCYRDKYYDASSTMLRRLFETLIIEIYENKKIEDRIKDADGQFLKLNALINRAINEKGIKMSSQTKQHLPKIKLFGDTAAHSRKIILKKHDIDQYKDEIRLSAEDLVSEIKI